MKLAMRGEWIGAILAAVWISALMCGPCSRRCMAHPANIAGAQAKLDPDGHFQIRARFDLLAFALNDTPQRIGDGPMNALLDGPVSDLSAQMAEAKKDFQRDFAVSAGGAAATIDSVDFPTAADVRAWSAEGGATRLPVMLPVVVNGRLPPNATTFSVRFPEILGTVVLTTELPYQEPVSEPLDAGAWSTPLNVPTPQQITEARREMEAPRETTPPTVSASALRAPPRVLPEGKGRSPLSKASFTWRMARISKPIARPSAPSHVGVDPVSAGRRPVPEERSSAGPNAATPSEKMSRDGTRHPQARRPQVTILKLSGRDAGKATESHSAAIPAAARMAQANRLPWWSVILRYVKMGYRHILPDGLDHILFVLGLVLLSKKTKALVWQITAFTVAHSITLALSLYGVVRLPPSIVEPIIAASIAFVAIENILTTDLKPWRPFVVFAFGLVHGMGFAGALLDLGLARQDFLTALVGFNVGVELGQLSVVAMALLAIGWFRSHASYRKMIVIPGSAAIAVIAVIWTIQRTL